MAFADTFMQPRARLAAQLTGLVLLALLIRVPFFSVPMINDEGGYAHWASSWTSAQQPYRDFEFGRPQAILLVYKAAIAIFGGSVEAFRLTAALFNCLTTVGIFLFAHKLFSERAAVVSAVLYALFSASPRIEGFTANAEIFTLAPLVLNAYLVWTRRWFWAGAATAVAFQLKPSGVEGCVLIALWIVLRWESWRLTLRSAALSLAGFIAFLIPCLLHGVWVGWDAFWYNQYTLRTLVNAPDVTALSAQLTRFEHGFFATLSAWGLPSLLCAIALPGMPKQTRAFCLAWLAAAFAGMEVGLWWDWHFFIQIMPPLCMAAGAGVFALPTVRYRSAWVAALALALGLFGLRDAQLWFREPRDISWQIYHRNGYLHADEIADYIKKTTAPDDSIYVAFSQAELYYLSGRNPAVGSQLFSAQATYIDGAWEKSVEAINARVPTLIVAAQPPPPKRMSAQTFDRLVSEGYALDRRFGSIAVFRRKRPPLNQL